MWTLHFPSFKRVARRFSCQAIARRFTRVWGSQPASPCLGEARRTPTAQNGSLARFSRFVVGCATQLDHRRPTPAVVCTAGAMHPHPTKPQLRPRPPRTCRRLPTPPSPCWDMSALPLGWRCTQVSECGAWGRPREVGLAVPLSTNLADSREEQVALSIQDRKQFIGTPTLHFVPRGHGGGS